MADIKSILKQEYIRYNHIQWLAEHVDLYYAAGAGEAIMENLAHYGSNIYTYTEEAVNAYKNFLSSLNNNPYEYMSGIGSTKEQYCIYARSLDGYIVNIDSEIFLPIGFLKTLTGVDEKSRERCVRDWLESGLKEHKSSVYAPFSVQITSGIQKNEKLCERFKAEKRITNMGIYMNAVFGIEAAVLLVYCIYAYFGQSGIVLKALMVIAALLCLFWEFCVVRGFKCVGRVKRAEKALDNIKDFENRYNTIYSDCFTVEYLLHSDTEIGQILLPDQYQKILTFIDSDELEKLKPIVPQPRKYYIQFIGLTVILILLTSGKQYGQIIQGSNMKEDTEAEAEVESAPQPEPEPESDAEPEREQRISGFDENGFVFADSDSRMLTEKELYALQDVEGSDFKTLLGFARNEIYARMGYAFKPDGIYYEYYMKYDWYRELSHREVTEDMFNDYERKNRDLIVTIEEREGFK